MTDPLPISPFRNSGLARVRLPGSKSITNRALILAALSNQTITLKGALFSRDTRIMAAALRELGFSVAENESSREITISGQDGTIPAADARINVGNAGTAARFLTAFLALRKGGTYDLDGDEAMRKRPMAGLLDILESIGAITVDYKGEKGFFPFRLHTHGIPAGEYTVDASASSQILSALLMVQPFAMGKASFSAPGVRPAYIEITRKMMLDFGWEEGNKGSYHLPTDEYQIEPDASAASYFVALPIATPEVNVFIDSFHPEKSIQGDIAFIKVLEKVGIHYSQERDGFFCDGSALMPTELKEDFNHFSDTFLTLAALSPVLGRKLTLSGLAHTRKQETDRVLGMAHNLVALGQTVNPTVEELVADDTLGTLEITPNRKEMERLAVEAVNEGRHLTAETYEDHRFAMSFGILGLYDLLGDGRPWLAINDPACCSKTFPTFFQTLDRIHQILEKKPLVVTIDGGAASGKSSTARGLSAQLDFLHVDTGSHYRAVTFSLLKEQIDIGNHEAVTKALSTLPLGTAIKGRSAFVTINGEQPTNEDIRSPQVNEAVSKVAAIESVRQYLFGYQRSLAQKAAQHGFAGLVMEGRDIGSVIFPEAKHKFFLEADESTRSARRASQGQADSIMQRDKLDQSRKTAPLICPEGATRIDNSSLSLEEVITLIRQQIEQAEL